MAQVTHFLLSLFCAMLRIRASLQLEVALRFVTNCRCTNALANAYVLRRRTECCGLVSPGGGRGWRRALWFVQPRTVVAWQQKRFCAHWRMLSQQRKPGRPPISPALRNLIKRMWHANPTSVSPRIVGELRTLGIHVAQSTVEKYRPRHHAPRSSTWKTFPDQHVKDLVSIDFFVVPTVNFRVLFVFIVLAHDRRRILHFNVTEHPTAQWTAQQLAEAFPFDSAPRYLLRDGDGIYGEKVQRRIKSLSIDEVVTAPALPWQNAYAERWVKSIKDECLSKLIVFGKASLRHALRDHLTHYHGERNHQGKDNVVLFPTLTTDTDTVKGRVAWRERLGGLLKYYYQEAA